MQACVCRCCGEKGNMNSTVQNQGGFFVLNALFVLVALFIIEACWSDEFSGRQQDFCLGLEKVSPQLHRAEFLMTGVNISWVNLTPGPPRQSAVKSKKTAQLP